MGPTRSNCVVCRLLLLLALGLSSGCYNTVHSDGGGQTRYGGSRYVNPKDVWLPPGYRIEVVTQGLNYPTGVTFDDAGRIYVTESGYSYGEDFQTPRLLRVISDGVVDVIAHGDNGPWNGVTWHDGNFYVAEGGAIRGGSILKITPDGTLIPLIEHLPSLGDHHTNGPVIGPDGFVYFGQGTATNSAIVGLDNYRMGWLKRNPRFHDIPAKDVTLAGVNYTTVDPTAPRTKLAWYQRLLPFLAPGPKLVETGAFSPYGTPTHRGQVVRGQVPCTGAIMRLPLEGGKPELVAWGLRNPFGLAFSPGGRLFVTENQYDVRGSRPVWGTGDLLWQIEPGAWYGWPDYFGPDPINDEDRFSVPHGAAPRRLLAKVPERPPLPVAKFGVHASADGLDFCRNRAFRNVGDAFVAEFGDMAPLVGKVEAPVGFRVVRVETHSGVIHPFAVNRGKVNAPASKLENGGLERPVAARFDPSGNALYVVDFGVMTVDAKGAHPVENTGVLWRITREVTR